MMNEAFYNHPFIESIKSKPLFTISDVDKMPVHMSHLKTYGEIIGGDFKDPTSMMSMENVDTALLQVAGVKPPNYAYRLQASRDKFVILDIEAKCPREILNYFMGLPYLYAERSLSGTGVHLVMPLPKNFFEFEQSRKIKLKHKDGYYEVLMDHWCTFTGDMLPDQSNPTLDWEEIYAVIAKSQKEDIARSADYGTLVDLEDIRNGQLIVENLNTILANDAEFMDYFTMDDDGSRREFNTAMTINKRLRGVCTAHMLINVSDDVRLTLITATLEMFLEHREKHDTYRDGMPWLMYNANQVVSRYTI